jgi:hypothetical protein
MKHCFVGGHVIYLESLLGKNPSVPRGQQFAHMHFFKGASACVVESI